MARGVYYSEFGGPDVLQVGEVETLPMGPDTVRLRVAGAGINPVDWKIMRGFLAGAFEHHFPVVPGWDVAGEVLEVGPSVPELKTGDTAYGYARLDVIGHGTAAEEVVLPIRTLAKAPTTIDLETAAAVPLAGLTAFQLIRRLDIQPGETVLVLGAGGGVGLAAIDVACSLGATVIAAASSAEKLADAEAMGATSTIAYGSVDLKAEARALSGGGVDVVIADYFANRISLRYGTPQGLSEDPNNNLDVDRSPRALGAADLNGDGLPELLVTSYDSGTLTVHRASKPAPRRYLQPRIFRVLPTPASVLAADLDLDGDLDLAVAHDDSATLLVLRNDTGADGDPLLVSAGEHFLRSGRYHTLAARDLDGDGFPELLSTNSRASAITLLRNRSR